MEEGIPYLKIDTRNLIDEYERDAEDGDALKLAIPPIRLFFQSRKIPALEKRNCRGWNSASVMLTCPSAAMKWSMSSSQRS